MQIIFEKSEAGEVSLLNKAELAKIYSRVFTTKDGKIILEDLANMSGMYRSNFIQNNSDYTSFLEGHRALFIYICSQLEEQSANIEGKI